MGGKSLEHLSKEELIRQVQQLEHKASDLENKASVLTAKNNHLQHLYDQLRRLVFGTKRERFIKENNPHQQVLSFFEESSKDVGTVKENVSYEREKPKKRNHPGRRELPAHLPVEEQVIEPKEDTSDMVRIGQEISEHLELIPAKLYIQRIIRPKYTLKEQKQNVESSPIVIAELQSRAIEKSIAGNSLLASIFVDKYVDHLPFYRQIERFKRENITIKSQTIDNWQSKVSTLLESLYECLKSKVLNQGYIQADESPIKVMDQRKKSKTSTGYRWVYYSPLEKIVLFDYRPTRGREEPEELLKDFKGYLQTDGYQIYDDFNTK